MVVILTAVSVLVLLFMLKCIQHKCGIKAFRWIFCIFLVYLSFVVYVTLVNKRSVIEVAVNIHPFKTYNMMFHHIVNYFLAGDVASALQGFRWIGYESWKNVLRNILLFIPLGYIVPFAFMTFRHTWKIVLLGLFVSLFIEIAQLITHRGWFDVDDLFHNTLGGWMGFGLYKRFLKTK